jgi:hypothetical protein
MQLKYILQLTEYSNAWTYSPGEDLFFFSRTESIFSLFSTALPARAWQAGLIFLLLFLSRKKEEDNL